MSSLCSLWLKHPEELTAQNAQIAKVLEVKAESKVKVELDLNLDLVERLT